MSEPAGDWQVSRSFTLATALDDALLAGLAAACADAPGVVALRGRAGTRRLRVRYDASRTQYRDVQAWLADQGVTVAQGRWARWRAAWYGVQDANLRDNARLPPPACCNRPPRSR